MCAGGADHGQHVSARSDRDAAEAKEDGRRSFSNPRQDVLIRIRWQFQRQHADKGPSRAPLRPLGRQSGKDERVVGLDFQRSMIGDPLRPRTPRLRQTEATALRILDLLYRTAPRNPFIEPQRGAAERCRQVRQDLTIGTHREVMQRGQWNSVSLSDIGGKLLEAHARNHQVGPVCQGLQRCGVLLGPTPGHELPDFTSEPFQFLAVSPGFTKETCPIVALRFQKGPRINPVGDRCQPSGLGEADQIGRDSHLHLMPAAQ